MSATLITTVIVFLVSVLVSITIVIGCLISTGRGRMPQRIPKPKPRLRDRNQAVVAEGMRGMQQSAKLYDRLMENLAHINRRTIMPITEISTYRELLTALRALSNDQLEQPVQIAKPKADCRPVPLMPGLAIGTVADFEFEGARSTVDNRYHADEVVVLVDANPFNADGALGYELRNEGPDEKPLMRHIPIYGAGGVTPRDAQLSGTNKETPAHVIEQCKSRMASMDRAARKETQ